MWVAADRDGWGSVPDTAIWPGSDKVSSGERC